nr:site-specific integrase [Lachnospiraceae bacterium]
LINKLECSKIKSGDPQVRELTENEIRRRFNEDNISFKIYKTSDGRYKLRTPFQMCRKEELSLLIELFKYYYARDPDANLTVSNVYDEWIAYFKRSYVDTGHRSALTHVHFEADWKRFYSGSWLAAYEIAKLKPSKIKEFYRELSANQSMTRKTLNNAKTILNHVFDYAVDMDYISVNNARSVRTTDLICKEEANEELVYSDEERSIIMHEAQKEDDVFARAIFLMFNLCIRIGELNSLKWSDIDFEARTVYIHSQIVRQKDKNGKYRYVYVNRTKGKKKEANRIQPMSDDAMSVLRRQRKENPFGEYVFLYNNAPLKTSTTNSHLKRICERTGVGYLSSHKIRFWSVVNMSKVLNPAEVQYMAGHLDPATTDHYRKRVSKINGVNQETWNKIYRISSQ